MEEDSLSVLFANITSRGTYHNFFLDEFPDEVQVVRRDKLLVLPLTRNLLRNRDKDVDVIHFDWLYDQFLVHDFTGSSYLDKLLTLARSTFFILDLLLLRLFGVRTVWTVHNKLHHERPHPRIERIVNICFSRYVTKIVVKCPRAKETVAEYYRVKDRSKIHVVEDGKYTKNFPNEVSKADARDELGIDDRRFVYLYFGNIRPYKGVPGLIRAYGRISCENTQLWVVGSPRDNLKQDIEEEAKDVGDVQVVFEYVPEEDVQLYVNSADVVVFPYTKEILNSGSVDLASSFGKPVIAPDEGCIPASLSEQNRFLYEMNDDEALQRCMEDAYDSDDLEEIGRANRSHVERRSWRRTTEEYTEIYRSITA